jgi:hypothetical protein
MISRNYKYQKAYIQKKEMRIMSKVVIIAVAVMLTVVAFAATVRAQEEQEIPKLSGNEKWNERIFYTGMVFPIVRYAVMFFCLLSGYHLEMKELIPVIGLMFYLKPWLSAVLDTLKDMLNVGKRVVGH